VQLDEILRALDPTTRAALQTWIGDLAQGVDGRGRDLSDALAHLAPFTRDTERLLAVLDGQEPVVRRLVRSTGEVFGALSERRGQLRALVRDGERVFRATAARDRDLAATVRALPAFEREGRRTVARLEGFAARTDPLVTQLRPAARRLSPTLRELSATAPDLEALLSDLDPLIGASRRGLPALERFTGDLRPTLAELDPPLRQLNPMLAFLGPYRSELTAFLANATAATNAFDVDADGRRLHYLRTTNPLNPESLAAYPRRIGTNRSNPYLPARAFDELARGLPSLDTRSCAAGVPRMAPDGLDALGALTSAVAPLAENIRRFAFGPGAKVAAPPCRAGTGGPAFPQVREAASSAGP
jgi:ABC-type transporter Mla subunit MlaD